MLTVFMPPANVLRWVEGGVAIRLDGQAPHTRFPAVPHAMLTLQMSAGRPGPLHFHTLSTAPTVHAHAGPVHALGLLVRPAAAACLLGARTGAQHDQVLSWECLVGPGECERLMDVLHEARTDAQRIQALEASLGRAMQGAAPERAAGIARLCAVVGQHGVQASTLLGLSARQLERRSQAILGVTPKTYQRVVRLHGALSAAVVGRAPPGAQLALDAGYFDQSHLMRDMRLLAGAPLQVLLREAQPGSAGWPLASRQALSLAMARAG